MTLAQSTLVHHAHEHGGHETYSKTLFGFWVYLMTDCVLFATLFATYAVLHNGTAGGPNSQQLFELPFALGETIILLISSFVCGIGMLAAHQKHMKIMVAAFFVTFFLGIAFLAMELSEFSSFVQEGNSWQRSAFLSSFFTLVGTHGLHIAFGLLWLIVIMIQLYFKGLTSSTLRRFACFSLFWHFLDVIWIFIFTIVYLMGVIVL
jgi:cytochrome o ubiquinol oxidase subunit 3